MANVYPVTLTACSLYVFNKYDFQYNAWREKAQHYKLLIKKKEINIQTSSDQNLRPTPPLNLKALEGGRVIEVNTHLIVD